MPVFNYLAINRDGVKIKGSVEAESVFLARNTLYQRKLFLLKIKMAMLIKPLRLKKVFLKKAMSLF